MEHSASAGWLLFTSAIYLAARGIPPLPTQQAYRAYAGYDTDLAATGSWLGFAIINGAMLTSPWTRHLVESFANAGAPWIGTMDDPVADLAARGWQATLTQLGEEAANYSRWPDPVIPRTVPDMPRHWLVTARQEPR